MASTTAAPASRAKPDMVELSLAMVCGLSLTLTCLFTLTAPLTNQIAGARDFVVYWATGQQLIHGANPYDRQAITAMEHAAGLPQAYPAGFMRNPPWALPLTLPLGPIGIRIGSLIWSPLLLGCLALSVRLLWIVYGRPGNPLHWLALSFAPALSCLIAGQTALFALLGLALFLSLHRTRPFLAGTALWLCMLKPHLFLPFGLVLAIWIVTSRSYKVLAGAATALAASCALVWWVDPLAWSQYAQMMRESGIQKEFIPCLAIVLRLWTSPQAMWIQYVPATVACVWAVAYFWPRRHTWDWTTHGGVLTMVSIFMAPYCWLFDQVMAIPALMLAAYRTRSRVLLVLLAAASVAMEITWGCGVKLASPLNLWTAPVWLAWYLAARLTSPAVQAEPSTSR